MIWFSHVKGPLGTYIRITYSAILDFGDRGYVESIADLVKRNVNYNVDVLCSNSIDDLYKASLSDPDIIDVLTNNDKDLCALLVYA